MGNVAKSRARMYVIYLLICLGIFRHYGLTWPGAAPNYTALGAKYRADKVGFLIGIPANKTLDMFRVDRAG